MIIKTVQCQINENGICDDCPSCTDCGGVSYCAAFNDVMLHRKTRGNLPACKDFLAESKELEEISSCFDGDIYEKEIAKPSKLFEPLLTFENVITNITSCRITGERKLLDLTLPITPENLDKCMIAYVNNGKIKVICEVQE